MPTKKVEKRDVQRFWSEKVPFFETNRGLSKIDLDYIKQVDETHLLYNPFLVRIRKDFARKGKTLIDIGCGGGMDSRAFVRLGLEVVSLDLNQQSSNMTKLGFKLSQLSGNVIQADAENLPFRDNCVDLVYSFGVLHHTPNTEKAAQEIYRVVRRSAFVMLYNRNFTYYAKRLRHLTMPRQEVFNMYDYTVLSKLYSKSEVHKMFNCFRTVKVKSRMFWAARNSKLLHLLLIILHVTGLERLYGSFNLIWAEK